MNAPNDLSLKELQNLSRIDVWVDSRGHANLDSFPLRFGLHFERGTLLTLRELGSIQQDEKFADRFHVDATFDIDGRRELSGHFVLAHYPGKKNPTIVTVWRGDVTTEFGLSELMRSLRAGGYTTPADWIAFHPFYLSGKLKTTVDLVDLLVSRKSGAGSITQDVLRAKLEEADRKATELVASYEKMRHLAERSRSVALEAIYHVDRLSDENVALISDKATAEAAKAAAEAGQIEAETARAQAEAERVQAEAARVRAESERADAEAKAARLEADNSRLIENERCNALGQRQQMTISAPDTLDQVLERQLHRGSSCTILVLRDGARWHMKTETFDPHGVVTQKARSLLGRRVRVTSWDPISQPGKWSSQGYFRNIYEVQ